MRSLLGCQSTAHTEEAQKMLKKGFEFVFFLEPNNTSITANSPKIPDRPETETELKIKRKNMSKIKGGNI